MLIVLLVIATSCGTGVAVPWFTDNFDNYEEGSLAGKPADQPVWTGPSGPVRIQTEFVNPPQQQINKEKAINGIIPGLLTIFNPAVQPE